MSKPRPSDQAVRERALDTGVSFIVQAPAGSGKTSLLIQRYLALLARVENPEEVIAITFTRKAAGEMRERITGALVSASDTSDVSTHQLRTLELATEVLERDRELGWGITEHPARLRIQTIDSLCASLTRQMPWLSRFGGPPGTVEDASALYRQAARETLALIYDEDEAADAVATVSAHLDNDAQRHERMLVDMLARRDQWLRHLFTDSAGGDKWRQELEAGLERALADQLGALRKLVADPLAAELVELSAYAGENLTAAGSPSPAAACHGLDALPPGDPKKLKIWQGIAEILLIKDGNWRRSWNKNQGFPAAGAPAKAMKKRAQELVAALQDEPLLRASLSEARGLPDRGYRDEQWRVLAALRKVLLVAAGLLRIVFSERGELDFTEVSGAALMALGDEEAPTDLALSLDYRIQHLLVDEFQDTSHSQFQLLSRLTAGWSPDDGRTLFLVGDPMQSIYRFREADVGLYLRAWEAGIGPVALEPLRLRDNFRSEAGLVAWLNESFPKVMPRRVDITTGAVSYTVSNPFRDAAAAPAVSVTPFLSEDPQSEAAAVVDVIRTHKEAKEDQTVAILVRSRSHLGTILPALRAAGLIAKGLDIDRLGERPVVQDLLALTRALLHPADRIAWLAILRAPWCGLTLADLHALAARSSDRVILDLLSDQDRIAQLSADGRARLEPLAESMRRADAERGRSSLRVLVESVWCALGGPACVEAWDLDDATAYLELLEALEAERGLVDLKVLEERVSNLFAAPSEGAADVDVMTIHKAKGLEFDVVIVPGLGRRPRTEDKRLLVWTERAAGPHDSDLLLAPVSATGADDDSIYDYLQRLEKQKSRYEAGRLLYVAATRAKRRLHLLGHAPVSSDDRPCPAKHSLLNELWPAVEETFQALADSHRGVAADGAARSEDESAPVQSDLGAIRRRPLGWKAPPPIDPVSWHTARGSVLEDVEAPVEFDWAGVTARHVGTLVHRMLAIVARDGPSAWGVDRLTRHRGSWRGALRQLGVPEPEVDAAVDRVRDALMRLIGDERGAWILDPNHHDARSEYAISGVSEGQVVNAVVDRTFVDERGTRWVVDYKTGVHEGADVNAFLEREQERYRNQLERYGRLIAKLDERPVRLGLYFPMLRGWREWPLS